MHQTTGLEFQYLFVNRKKSRLQILAREILFNLLDIEKTSRLLPIIVYESYFRLWLIVRTNNAIYNFNFHKSQSIDVYFILDLNWV